MTTSDGPTAEQIDEFNDAAHFYSIEKDIPFEVAVARLGNLLVNMRERPLETEIYISRVRAEDIEDQIEYLKDRVAYLEDVIGASSP